MSSRRLGQLLFLFLKAWSCLGNYGIEYDDDDDNDDELLAQGLELGSCCE